jgi:hypothetical protein
MMASRERRNFFIIASIKTRNQAAWHNWLAMERAAAYQSQIHGSGGVAAAEFGCATRTAPLRAMMASRERRNFFMIPSV